MTHPAIPGLTRHFCTLGDRQVHYRRSGTGPPVLALHRLPRSSRDLARFMTASARFFTVIAPDAAGYGNSWGLSKSNASLADYAADTESFLDAMGLERVGLFGEGEGATLALQLFVRNPERYACVALHDLKSLSATDAAIAVKALPRFNPSWDGSHLAWLWAFLREENCFAPWWQKSLATRLDADMPNPEELQNRAIQFLADGRAGLSAGTQEPRQHGRGYHTGMIAALNFDVRATWERINVPTLLLDQRCHGDRRKPELFSGKYVTVSRPDEAYDTAIDFLRRKVDHIPQTAPSPGAKPIHGVLWQDFVTVPGGQVHFQMNSDEPSIPLLVQHDAASSISTVEPITRSLVGHRTVMAFDLPGSGDSDNTIGCDGVDVGTYADALQSVLKSMGLGHVDFYGMWGGGFVGLEMALRNPQSIRRLVMSNVFEHRGEEQRLIQAHYTPDVSPVWHGGHLMQCWHQMRDQGIYYPWFDRTARGVIPREPFLATDMVHERVCSLLKAGNMYRMAYQAHFAYPTYAKLRQSRVPTLVATTQWDPNNAHTQEAATAARNVTFQYLDEDFTKWGLSFLPFLRSDAPGELA